MSSQPIDSVPEPTGTTAEPADLPRLRQQLQDEIHARPRLPVDSPHSVSHIALLREPGQAGAGPDARSSAMLKDLCEELGLPQPPEGARHHLVDLGELRLKWERHGEFDDLTVYRSACSPDAPFDEPALASLPKAWLDRVRPELIAALHIAVLPRLDCPHPQAYFDPSTLTAASTADGAIEILTDFRFDEAACTRFLVLVSDANPARTGHEVQRLVELDVYRTMAMLAFPMARSVASELDEIESALSDLVLRLENARTADEPGLLGELTRLASTVERIAGVTGFRFAAARAYQAIVRNRGEGLRTETPEGSTQGITTPTAFLERRFEPSMALCEAVERRLGEVAERVTRASALLRTRVEIERERQNHALLAAMNKRTRLQLHLQQTVEGLSVAAITYYAVGLVGYLAKGASAIGWITNPELIQGIAVVPVALAVWLGVREIRARVHRRMVSSMRVRE